MHPHATRGSTLATAFALGLGCTAIVGPNDNTTPCEKTQDCDDVDDNRFESRCVFEQGEEGDGVCVGAFRELSCNPGGYETVGNQVHPVKECIDRNPPSTYLKCTADQAGQRGCPGPCDGDLEENQYGVCDDPKAANPAVPSPPPDGFENQDILDQFCRSYFCDVEFVCDRSGSNPVCKQCDPDKDYGEGGCGNLYRGGELSPVYTTADDLEAACKAPESTTEEPVFGSCEPPAPDM